ncbi:MAG: MFS transporter [Myxococcales bacterium]|nr:MFS transporter [Myxococcales bacterium]
MSPQFCTWLNFLAFGTAFAGWVLFGPSARTIATDLALPEQFVPILKSIPVLIGSTTRIPIGLITDRYGSAITFSSCMVIGGLGLIGASQATSTVGILLSALFTGVLGATFVVGVQSISQNIPVTRQGYALGVFGAGNVGTAISAAGFPLLATVLGWKLTFIIYGLSMVLMGIMYYALLQAHSSPPPRHRRLQDMIRPLGNHRVWIFGLFYMASFGVFVASTLILNDFYIDIYHVSTGVSGLFAAGFCIIASLSRIPGGMLSDRFNAFSILKISLLCEGLMLLPAILTPPLWVVVLCVFSSGIGMGFGMAATFKLIPQEFPEEVGAVSGLVGALGGLSGFFLPLAGMSVSSIGHLSDVWVLAPTITLVGVTTLIATWVSSTGVKPMAKHARIEDAIPHVNLDPILNPPTITNPLHADTSTSPLVNTNLTD